MSQPMPKLSVDLQGPRSLGYCQACGVARSTGGVLEVWEEKDEQDQPTKVYLQLCVPCGARLIEPHPRLYERMPEFAPIAGAMEDCRSCKFSEQMRCLSPLLKENGGAGLPVNYVEPIRALVDGSKYRGPLTVYRSPPICRGKEQDPPTQGPR